MIARLPGTSNAPPIPWIVRAAISWATVEASAQPIDAAANSATPAENTRRRPNRSPAAPPTSSSAASISAYDSTTHCTSARLAPNSRCSAGSATFTSVESMNTMLEATVVAASTPRACWAVHGVVHGVARMTAESEGSDGNAAIDRAQVA
jgi:hypothetical protein